MGNLLAQAIATGLGKAMACQGDCPRTLKISPKGVPDFGHLPEGWSKWKTSALNTLIAASYKEIIADPQCAYSHDTENEIVYTLLATATIDSYARHVVAKHDDEKDGYAAWSDLTELFDGKSRNAITVKL